MITTRSRTLSFGSRLAVIATLFAVALLGMVASASAAAFDPENVISNENMRDAHSMSEGQVQAFLETQPGPLKSFVTTDNSGVMRRASTIIWQACQEHQISPKVMLTMLQKEQSLLTRTTLATNTLSRAIGAGCPNGTTNTYPGFGRQMWNGARMLSSYGQGNPSFPVYYTGIAKTIYKHSTYGTKIHPKSLATFKLYVYNPSVPGNTNFSTIYNRFFGSPLASPRMKTFHRFRNKQSGTYLYTSSIAERTKLRQGSYAKRWTYEGAKFSVDTSVPVNQTIPLYRFRHLKTGKQSYTISPTKLKQRTSKAGKKTWSYSGVAYRVSTKHTPGALTIYKFLNRKTGAYFLTHSKAAKDSLRKGAANKKKWRYEGVAYYLPRAQ